MKNLLIYILIMVGCFSIQGNSQNKTVYNTLVESFRNPPVDAHPKVYWWCLNGNIDTIRAKQEFASMKEAGIRGLGIVDMGSRDTMIPGGPAFMGDESLRNIKTMVTEAGKLGLKVRQGLASSWNLGGRWVKPENGAKSLYFSKYGLKSDKAEKTIKLPFPKITFSQKSLIGGTNKPMIPFDENGRPVYYEDVAVLAIPANIGVNSLDTAEIIDVTPYFNPKTDILNWDFPGGDWDIYRYVCSNSGQQLVIPSPNSAGLTIDHFDSVAVETHLRYIIDRLLPVLGDFRNTALESFYFASYEARGFVWTPSLANEFRKVNGYDIKKYIPSLFDLELFDRETTKQVQKDFKKTLSELMINNLYRKSKEICNSYGLKLVSEAGGPGFPLYNGPAEPLKALGSLDVPRGEFWINHSRFYKDTNADSIDILRVVKEVSAASHIYKKGIVEEEAFTSFQHWQEGPSDMKPFGDRAFCEGMNRVVFHGFNHNISGSGFPGYAYGAGTHFDDKRVWWAKARPFVEYLTRISAVAQETDFFADVLWYYGDKIPNAATAKNTHFCVGPGYDYEVINTDILVNDIEVKDGKLVLSNGASFSLLALENEECINPEVLKKLKDLVGQGAVVVGEKPKGVARIAKYNKSVTENEMLINHLWTDAKNPKGSGVNVQGKIWSGITPAEMLEILNVSPDINYKGKESYLLDFIHYKKDGLDVYFICNPENKWISRNVGFRINNKVPEIWDPVTGEIIPVSIYNQNKEYTEIPLTLAPYGSLLLVFNDMDTDSHYTGISGSGKYTPFVEFTKDGVCFLQDGDVTLKKDGQSEKVKNENRSIALDGDWEVSFTKGWGAPQKVTFSELISWTDSKIEGIKYYSGIATYKTAFQYEPGKIEGKKIYLDLGEISKVGEVWLNGQRLGITWARPHRFDVTAILKTGENTLTVEVANTWSNRLTGDALTGEKYTNTNIKKTIIPTPGMQTGDQTRYTWDKVPLIRSGLLGPVSLVSVKLVK